MNTPNPTTTTTTIPTAGHTPGPWHEADVGVYAKTLNGHGNFYVVALPFPNEEPNDHDRANLRLIAAAPELLAVLQAMLCHPVGIDTSKTKEMAARAAIAKATGGAS